MTCLCTDIRKSDNSFNHCIKSIDEIDKTAFKPFDSDIDSESQFMNLGPDVQYFNAANGFTYGEIMYYLEDSLKAETQYHNIQSSHFSLINHTISEVLLKM